MDNPKPVPLPERDSIHTIEAFKDARDIIRWNSDSRILDSESDSAACAVFFSVRGFR